MHRPTTVLRPGARIPARQLTAVSGAVVPLPDPDRVVHLQFRRFAGCPICNLHLQSIVRRHHAIGQAGVREVVIFHSTDEDLRLHTPTLPFDVVADPDQLLYAEFGVTASPRALLHPKAWAAILLAIPRSATAIARGREHAPAAKPHGGRLGLPADFPDRQRRPDRRRQVRRTRLRPMVCGRAPAKGRRNPPPRRPTRCLRCRGTRDGEALT